MSIFKSIKGVFQNVNEYIEVVANALHDGNLSPEELSQLHKVAIKLKMTASQRRQADVRAIEKLMDGAMSDGYVDEIELKILENSMKSLGLSADHIKQSKSQAISQMLLFQQIASGQIPTLPSASVPIALLDEEEAYLVTSCRIEEERVVSTRRVGGYSGFSFRICKGVSYHIGGSRGRSFPVTANVAVSHGNLVLTSQRAIYLGTKRGFTKPWNKIMAIEPYNNAVTFYFSDRQNATTLLYDNPKMAPFVEAICGSILK